MNEPQKQPIEKVSVEEDDKTEATDKAEEYLSNWKRERADFLNYANEDLVLEMMELVDDLEIVTKEVPGVGLENVSKRFSELFKKYGVERIKVEGQFNPALHEAVLGEGSIGWTKD